jgi:hypothetical protein|tara:strand:- start:37 stop:522 length:486 start_codon:yes stop_codon:yes gene_type:complete
MAIDKIQSESINLADNFAFTGTVTGAGGVNTPAFSVYQSSQQSIATNTITKLTSLSENYDTASAFASDKFTVPSGQAGKYVLAATATYRTSVDIQYAGIHFYKNGSNIRAYYIVNNDYNTVVAYATVSASASDYYEVYAEHQAGQSVNIHLREFSGFKIIE